MFQGRGRLPIIPEGITKAQDYQVMLLNSFAWYIESEFFHLTSAQLYWRTAQENFRMLKDGYADTICKSWNPEVLLIYIRTISWEIWLMSYLELKTTQFLRIKRALPCAHLSIFCSMPLRSTWCSMTFSSNLPMLEWCIMWTLHECINPVWLTWCMNEGPSYHRQWVLRHLEDV